MSTFRKLQDCLEEEKKDQTATTLAYSNESSQLKEEGIFKSALNSAIQQTSFNSKNYIKNNHLPIKIQERQKEDDEHSITQEEERHYVEDCKKTASQDNLIRIKKSTNSVSPRKKRSRSQYPPGRYHSNIILNNLQIQLANRRGNGPINPFAFPVFPRNAFPAPINDDRYRSRSARNLNFVQNPGKGFFTTKRKMEGKLTPRNRNNNKSINTIKETI